MELTKQHREVLVRTLLEYRDKQDSVANLINVPTVDPDVMPALEMDHYLICETIATIKAALVNNEIDY